jgi:hypothetical protein
MSTCSLLLEWGSSAATCLSAGCYSSGVEWSDMSTCPLLFQWGSSGATCLPTRCFSIGLAVEQHVYLPAVIPVG